MFSIDADPRYAKLSLRTNCAQCGAHLPVNGPAPTVDCAACSHTTDVPERLFRDLLQGFERSWPDSENAGTVVRGDITWRWKVEPVEAPACASCGANLPHPTGSAVPCGECGANNPVIADPENLRTHTKTARWVIGGRDDLSRPDTPPKPVALQCPSCGGGLTIGTDRERITRCDFCSNQVHLPDAVWRQLHPPRKVVPWFVCFEGESQAAKRHRKEQEKEAHRQEQAEAKRQKKERKNAQRRKEQQAREAKEEQARSRRNRFGLIGTTASWVVCLGAIGVMAISFVIWAVPGGLTLLGLSGDAAFWAERGVVLAGVIAFLGATVFGAAVAAWRAQKPIFNTVFSSAFTVVLLTIPIVGALSGLVFGVMHLQGRFPSPTGVEHKGFRHQTKVGWPMAPLFMVGGLFLTIGLAIVFEMTIWELLMALGED